MTEHGQRARAEELLDVRRAAALVGRHPETVRRWVGSGRLAARRRGNRLFMVRADVEAAAGLTETVIGLAEWARARAALEDSGADGSRRSAADLVIEDRVQRAQEAGAPARR